MSNSTSREVERVIGGFASCMSTALTLEKDNDQPLKNSSDVLPKFISAHLSPADVCMVMPTLMIKYGEGQFSRTNNSTTPKEKAALNLARRVSLTSKELEAAPMVLLMNICKSFTFLIDSRLRSSTQVLLQKSSQFELQHKQQQFQSQHPNPNTSSLLTSSATFNRLLAGLLSCSDFRPIAPCTVVTSFRVLPASEVSPDGEVVMPLVLETVIDLKIFQKELETIHIVAPGTIKAVIIANDFRIGKAEIVLDTAAFLASLMKQARHAVRRAIQYASKIASGLLGTTAKGRILDNSHHLTSSCSGGSLHGLPSKPSFPQMVHSSQNLKLQLAAAVQAQQSLNNAVNTVGGIGINTEEASLLMPKPRCRPGPGSNKNKRSFADITSSLNPPPTNGQKNAAWDFDSFQARERAIASGLSLLTAAARMNHQNSNMYDSKSVVKRQKTSTMNSTDHMDNYNTTTAAPSFNDNENDNTIFSAHHAPRKSTSCPRL
mmetsp:Transcript_5346/g.5891  ORF Transcript_5346/g.5891 Transcript_5346/m.5891 type:complete len:489 (-) Transcript_5346:156-1622(-)